MVVGRWLSHGQAGRIGPSHTAAFILGALMQDGYRNQGGFHMIGSGRDKIEKADQLEAAARVGGRVPCGRAGR